MIPEDTRNALIAGGMSLVVGFLALFPRAHKALPFVFLACCAVLTHFAMLDRAWALESLESDADWAVGARLIGWMMISALGLVRLSGWSVTVAVAAVLGDRFAALGLVAGEADPRRRARLVLAASGASLLGWTGSPVGLTLGWGGWPTVGLALALAAVGWVGRPAAVLVREPGRPFPAVMAGLAGAFAVLVGWMWMVGGTAEWVATAIEQAPLLLPRAWRAVLAVGGVLGGALTDEGVAAMVGRAVFDRSLEVLTRVPVDAVRAGIAVGGGLPLLVLTRSSLRVGLPLWAVQVALVVAWAQWGLG